MENKVLWDNKTYHDPLRKPNLPPIQNNTVIVEKPPTLKNNLDNPFTTQGLDDIIANSSLKVDAPEFIPRSLESKQISAVSSRIQDRLKIHRSESDCETVEVIGDNTAYSLKHLDTENDIKRIRQIINTLTKNPGQFDDLLQIFMDTVAPYLEDIILLSNIVQILVNEVRLTHFVNELQ